VIEQIGNSLGKTPDDDIDYGLGDHPIVKNEEVEEGDG
jgi:hypothetical protein